MAEPLATIAELSAYLHAEFSTDETSSATLALTIASDKVRLHVRRYDGKFLNATSATGDLKGIVLAVATRIYSNPTGMQQQTAGAESVSYSYGSTAALTAGERAELKPYRRRAYTIETNPYPAEEVIA